TLASSNGRIAIILPRGTFWTQYIQLAEFDIGLFLQKLLQDQLKKPIEVNCGLIAFTVRDGIAAADPVLIDTDKNVMTAKGGFSFKDESLDFAFRADGKKFSLFSGQSPVGIKGYFAAPRLSLISPQLITRSAVGVGLGLVASPLAAVLAFVDVGDAKSAACGPVLAGANASAQRTKKGELRKDVGKVRENRAQAGDRKQ
ncbi:MAG: AsmA family protein, partial [Rhizorhabdus sp.]|nr:AsmA family protein [Rhizorhabdus sp.]